MPTYEYQCNACGREFERMQKITEAHVASCPHCGSSDTRRLISLTSFVLKGTGWYVTDYARKGGNGGGGNGSKHHATSSSTSSPGNSSGKEDKPAKSDGGSAKPASDA